MGKSSSFLQRFLKSRTEQGEPPRPTVLPELLLTARRLANHLNTGPHNDRRAGDGHDFWQFRPHLPTEPASMIDWKQSARSPDPEQLWVREQEQQAPYTLFLWVDQSPSMRWRSSSTVPRKYDTALSDALALGQAALLAGEQVGVIGQRKRLMGRQALSALTHNLTQPSIGDNILPALNMVPPQASILLVSDFLWDDAQLRTYLAALATHPGRVALLCVLDPQEHHLPFSGSVKFVSCEDEPALTLPATESLHQAYHAQLKDHLLRLTDRPRGATAPFLRLHVTNQEALPALADCHRYLEGRA